MCWNQMCLANAGLECCMGGITAVRKGRVWWSMTVAIVPWLHKPVPPATLQKDIGLHPWLMKVSDLEEGTVISPSLFIQRTTHHLLQSLPPLFWVFCFPFISLMWSSEGDHKVCLYSARSLKTIYNIYPQICYLSEWGTLHYSGAKTGECCFLHWIFSLLVLLFLFFKISPLPWCLGKNWKWSRLQRMKILHGFIVFLWGFPCTSCFVLLWTVGVLGHSFEMQQQ